MTYNVFGGTLNLAQSITWRKLIPRDALAPHIRSKTSGPMWLEKDLTFSLFILYHHHYHHHKICYVAVQPKA